ncbi:MAG: IS1634 family transposase [Verrucomicrobia bacterium]|nr:IS1634 family transposase [Verrucomicrobiota bacterium]MBU4290412.1 IS1634 family transposase [Verrucomicrobiota bacterium]MBU4497205.1 IS1634 family transposase [Verrucomicrobiota bacterium]
MFLRATHRRKDGKEHRYWSIVENRRVRRGRTVQKTVLYLGEINDAQQAGWCRTIEALEGDKRVQLSLFPEDRRPPPECYAVQVQMQRLKLSRPRQWGACWLALELWGQLELDRFWQDRLKPSREGTRWLNVLKTLACYRLIDPGSEWRLHRLWFDHSAMADLLGEDFGIAEKDTLYRCLDKLLAHKTELFSHLHQRWATLFDAKYDVLLYDLTSTYFESNPPFTEDDKRKFGYSRDKRPDCVQVVVALIVTPEGFPLAYEVLAGNTADKTTLRDFLKRIEQQYGKASRIWVMDRGIPTEALLQEMRASDPPVLYLVGTPKGRLSRLEERLTQLPWQAAREGVAVKLLPEDGEVYVLAQSHDRVNKERAMRQRQLKALWKRLKQLGQMKQTRDQMLLKLGAAKQLSPSAWRLVDIQVPSGTEPLRFSLRKDRLRDTRRREGRYLLRTNLTDRDPATLWQFYMQLVRVEEAFRTLKGDLAIRPIYHQSRSRIEAHIFVAFLAYCLQVTLAQRLKRHASGLTPRSVLDQMKMMQMLDVRVPTTDGRWLHMARYTQPDKTQQLLLAQLGLNLPEQPPPKITHSEAPDHAVVVKT